MSLFPKPPDFAERVRGHELEMTQVTNNSHSRGLARPSIMRCALVLIAACGGVPNLPETPPDPPRAPTFHQPSADRSTCKEQPPIGDPSQRSVRELPGFTIAEPESCPGGAAYIRIERLAGSRALGIGQVKGGGFAEGCMDATKFATCSTLNVGAVLELARHELADDDLSVGAGPCGDLQAAYDRWNFAIGTHDWNDVDRVTRKVAEIFDRYDLKGFVGISVDKRSCFVLL